MKFQFIVIFSSLFFSLNAFSLDSCSCFYSRSAGHEGEVSLGQTITFDHNWGSGGTCTATCNSNCSWTNKSSGCNGFSLPDKKIKTAPTLR